MVARTGFAEPHDLLKTDPVTPQAHHLWLASWQREVEEDYERLHATALVDPQQSGHGGESTWQRLLEAWLPPAYEVGTRKYIVPEEGADSFETDLVVFNPGYPERLRGREHVLAGGVAAAFSVKLTLDSAGIRDGVDRAVRLNRSMKPRTGSPRSEINNPVTVGLLAHSHAWKQPESTPRENLASNLWANDLEMARHPRESLDLVCVADLASVATMRMTYMPPHYFGLLPPETLEFTRSTFGVDPAVGAASTAMTMSDLENEPAPVAIFVASLVVRLAATDPTLRPFADGLRMTNTLGSGSGSQRWFPLTDVYENDVISQLPRRIGLSEDWPQVIV